jgi:hypothetical protein
VAIFIPAVLREGRGKELLERVRTMVRTLRNTLMWLVVRSDYRRWTSAEGLEEWWSARTDIIAELVPPDSRVIEFGAGRRHLEKHLPLGCTYTPLDLVDRGPGTIVCDLNRRPLPDLRDRAFDVAVFAGVLEYLRDVPSLIAWLRSIGISTAIVSFDPVPAGLSFTGRVRERRRRLYFGYMCNLTEAELVRCFDAAQMRCVEKRQWTHQVIIRFEKRP